MATFGKFVVFCLSILFICCLEVSFSLDKLDNAIHQGHSFSMRQESSLDNSAQRVKRSLRNQLLRSRHRRDAGDLDGTCQEQNKTLTAKLAGKKDSFSHKFQFENETKYSIALAWAGENSGELLVVTTEEFFIFAKPSTIYRSTDNGKTFNEINDRIDGATIKKNNGLQKHPHAPSTVFVVCYDPEHPDNTLLFVTRDGGATFKKMSLPFSLSGALDFHPKKEYKELILTTSEDMDLYLSKNGGETWKRILQHAANVKWSTRDSDSEGTIYATVDTRDPDRKPDEPANFILKKSVDFGGTWKTLLENVYTFGMQGKFLYASQRVSPDSVERIMKVSTDGGANWNEAQLPTITTDRFYSILDMSEELIFMHVDNPGDTGHGTLYTSDATGIIFSESLQKHLYPNYIDLTDFYKVNSMRGVYLASQLASDNSIHTVITYDRGGEWVNLTRPAGVPCKDETQACFLQIHNQYSMSRGIPAQPPLTVENAPGIILVHGHVASSLQTTKPDVFVSSDGGYTWLLSLEGPHHYQIADHGGLLIAVPSDTDYPNVIKFSTDEGRCWHTYKFTEDKIKFTGVLTEPGNKAMSVGIWGFGAEDKKWRVHVINFTQVIDRQCLPNDYEEWLAHGDNVQDSEHKGCLLGKKEIFKRLKKDSWCYNGFSYMVQRSETKCTCTKDDFECDYGYHRNENEVCVEDLQFKKKGLKICWEGQIEELITQGYRKIPGDSCSDGFQPKGDKMLRLGKGCVQGDKSIIDDRASSKQATGSGSRGHNNAIIVVVVLTTLLVAVLLLGYFVRRHNLLRQRSVNYRYSQLNENDGQDVDNDIEYALAGHTSLYEDDSDEEIGIKDVPAARVTPSYGGASRLDSTSNGKVPNQKSKSYHDDSDDDLLD